MKNKIRFVEYPIEFDEKNYGYALCSGENCYNGGIEIPRPEESGLVAVECPKCGKRVAIYLIGKNTRAYKELFDFSKKL